MSMRPYGYPALCRLLSTASLGLAVWKGTALVPVEKLGELGPPERAALALATALLWLLGLGRLPGWIGPRGMRPAAARRLEARIGLASLGLALACLLPLSSYDWSRALWRSRSLLPVHLLLSAAVCAGLFLRSELSRLPWQRLRTGSGAVASLGGVACLLVLGAESILDWTLFQELRFVPDHASVGELTGNFALNALFVAGALGLVWGLTDRFGLAVLATGSSVLGLSLCNALKLSSLREPVRLFDFFYLGELGAVLADFLPAAWLGPAGALGLALFAAALKTAHPLARVDPDRQRVVIALAGLAVLFVLGRLASLEPAARRVWLPWQTSVPWDARQASLAEGMLFHFLGNAFETGVSTPEGYTPDELERIRSAVPASDGSAWRAWDGNVVVLMVESWMDPDDLPVTFTADPTPELHGLMAAHGSGRVLSPVFGSGSANAEFEVLTGLSMRFLPVGSLPYRQYVRHDLPALPRLFRDHGHRTVGILVDPPSYFERPTTYPRLGFEEVVWLHDDPDVERDASGHWASDQAVVERIVATLEDERPAFVFAFTNASHAPYGRARQTGLMVDGLDGLDVLDAPTPDARAELAGYGNALRAVDRAVADLTRRLEALDEPTVLVVLGDHQPPLACFPALGLDADAAGRPGRHSVPILLWTSFAAPRRELAGPQSGVGLAILETLGLEPDPLGHVVRAALESGSVRDREAYRRVQHDVLFGAPALQDWFWPDAPPDRAAR